jgi:hypothetical protein
MVAKNNSNIELLEGNEFQRLSKIFHSLTGESADIFQFPGLQNRYGNGSGSAVVTSKNNYKTVLTYRTSENLAELEAEVLKLLSKENAPVPNLIARRGKWLVQEYLEGVRLSQAIDAAGKNRQKELIYAAIGSLVSMQTVAQKLRLNKLTKPISISPKWRINRINFPKNLGNKIGLFAPSLNDSEINEALIIRPDTFIKWDARAGNAILGAKGEFSWFDWEHCGTRCSIDDLVWFLSDEWLPSNSRFDREVIEQSCPLFMPHGSEFPLERYLLVHGTLFMCGRLDRILKIKGSGRWWNRDYCLKFEQMGITKLEACRLAKKASEWAVQDKLVAPLGKWLVEVHEFISSID